MRNFLAPLLLTLLSLVQVSCKSNDTSSILLIAVDQLTVTDVPCNQEDAPKSGLHTLCDESVRFSHAFTTSTLSAPAIASLLTGLYPYQHRVRHNGGPALAAEFELSSELALKNGYHTSFFSGGAPVLRKTGLNQGFEHFEDNIVPTFSRLFRPFKKSVDSFTRWLKQEANNEPFFTFFYVPDLLYTTTETTTLLGESRNLSFESQLEEFDDSLHQLIQHLKTENRWDNTTVILVGLNGHSENDRLREIKSLNLHGENTQVAVLIKPSQKKKRDQAIHWKVDQNISLADIGRTLFEILGQKKSKEETPPFFTHSLTKVLRTPEADWPEDRLIVIESGWADWRNVGNIRSAAISQHVLFVNDEKPLLYNTLVDRLEVNPLPLLQESLLATTANLQNGLAQVGFKPYFGPSPEWSSRLKIPFSRWIRADQEAQLLGELRGLAASTRTDQELQNWTAQIALRRKDWATLKKLGIQSRNPLWQFVADRNLGGKSSVPRDLCFNLLYARKLLPEEIKKCSDPLFLELVDWLRAEDRSLASDIQKNRFERSFRNYMLDQTIQRYNIAGGLIWDTSAENGFTPTRTSLALQLPENLKLLQQLSKALQTDSDLSP